MCRWHHSYGRKQRGTEESLQLKVKEESENAGLKPNIQKMKIMASGPIISWQIDGETMETGQTLFSWAPKSLHMVTAAVKLKKDTPWKKNYDKPRQHIKKQKHYLLCWQKYV